MEKWSRRGVINSALNAAKREDINGEVAEWSNAAVLKTVVLLSRDRGFEPLLLRRPNQSRQTMC